MAACRRDSSLTERNETSPSECPSTTSTTRTGTSTSTSTSTIEATDYHAPWQLAEEIRH